MAFRVAPKTTGVPTLVGHTSNIAHTGSSPVSSVVDSLDVAGVGPPKMIDPSLPVAENEVMIGTYNVENLFDAEKDPNPDIHDEMFTPEGVYKWTEEKVAQKIKNLGRAIRTVNNGKGPDLLALNEVENMGILKRLNDEALADLGYKSVVHLETADWRGIDNAILSRFPLKGEPILHDVHRPESPIWGDQVTRGILEATFDVKGVPLTVFVCHLPMAKDWSAQRKKQRLDVAAQLRALIDKRLKEDPDRELMVLGDFNGNPGEPEFGKQGLRATANARHVAEKKPGPKLYNTIACLADQVSAKKSTGRVKSLEDVDKALEKHGSDIGALHWSEKWWALDHVYVSKGLLDDEGLSWVPGSTQVVREPMLLDAKGRPKTFYDPDRKYGDQIMSKTGYSDHLPIVTRLRINSG